MTKQEYLDELRRRLSALPSDEMERTVAFYTEAIDDRIEAGCTEAEAVADLEPPAQVAERLVAELPTVPRLAAKFQSLSLTGLPLALVIAAVILGAPLWICLLVAGIMLVAGCFAGLGGILIGCWATVGALLFSSVMCMVASILCLGSGSAIGSLCTFGMGLVMGAVGLVGLHLAVVATGLLVRAIAWLARKVYSLFGRNVEPPAWKRAPMKPAWRIAHLVAAGMAGVGIVACLGAWGLSGFDTQVLSEHINANNVIITHFPSGAGAADHEPSTSGEHHDGAGKYTLMFTD